MATAKAKKSRTVEGAATKCIECGGPLKSKRETDRYTLAGGWSVTLRNAEVLRCQGCGYREVVIPDPLRLHRTIAAAVVRKASRLTGAEVTFLRTHLDMSGVELAKTLGVTPSSLSRWEKGHEPIGAVPDRLLRALVMLHDWSEDTFHAEVFQDIAETGGPLRLVVQLDDSGNWRVAA